MGFLLFLREEENPSLMLLVGNKEIKVFLAMCSFHQFLGVVTQPKMKLSVPRDSPSCSGQAVGRGPVTRHVVHFLKNLKTLLDLFTL